MRVSLIISVYKDTDNLRIILDSLNYQSTKSFQIVVSEDGESLEMNEFLSYYESQFEIIHSTHPDQGWRKNKALNRAIQRSSGDYLIFIDGDCVPHHKFIESHIRLADANKIVAGKRVKLGPTVSALIKDKKINILQLEKFAHTQWLQMLRDNTLFYEEAFYFGLDRPLGLINSFRKMKHLKGCNMSFFRDAIERVNGFDESYTLPAVGEDADIQWRMEGLGYRLVSARNAAVLYHLYHKENWTDQSINLQRMQENMRLKKYVCENGLFKKLEYENQRIN